MKKFIVFEGIDGSGKSTQAKLLQRSLEKKKLKSILTREPGGTNFSEKIRNLIVKNDKDEILPLTELLLIYASRHEHVFKKIIPNLKTKNVICDRFFFSTICYQILTNKIPINIFNFLHKNFSYNLIPDITIILSLDPIDSIKRSLKRRNDETKFELKDKKFHQTIFKGFNDLSKKKNVKLIKSNKGIDEVHIKIIDFLNTKKIFKNKIPYYF